jgi:predicted O-methyltransferase YrrM
MAKAVVVTLLTHPDWNGLADVTLPSQREYARRIGADFRILDKRIYQHPHYDKWQLLNLLDEYDRLLYLDCDVIIRSDCPNLFELVPEECIGGENELLSFPNQAHHFATFIDRMGMAPVPCRFYVNGGVFVASSCHRNLFRPPEAELTDLPWPEQSHFNARLHVEKIPVYLLPPAFNDRHRRGNYLQDSFILHYSVASMPERIQAANRDLTAWNLIERQGRPQSNQSGEFPPGDYVSPGLKRIRLDFAFSHMIVGNPAMNSWPYLRRGIPHNWYVDQRQPTIGFINRDEAHLLYNNARQFRNQKALEVGCWLGWSAAHLAAAGVILDVIDPLLAQAPIRQSVVQSLTAVLRRFALASPVTLHAGSSPSSVESLGSQGKRWSLIFIDGSHEAPDPLRDTVAAEPLATDDAMILFHDLTAPAVGQGLDYLRDRGWNTLVYQTMQIMGVAWRGSVQPAEHQPDPSVDWVLPDHLRGYRVSGEKW